MQQNLDRRKNASSVSLRLPPSPTGEGIFVPPPVLAFSHRPPVNAPASAFPPVGVGALTTRTPSFPPTFCQRTRRLLPTRRGRRPRRPATPSFPPTFRLPHLRSNSHSRSLFHSHSPLSLPERKKRVHRPFGCARSSFSLPFFIPFPRRRGKPA